MSEVKKCCLAKCNNTHTKKTDRYCKECRDDYQKRYRNKKAFERMNAEFKPKLVVKAIELIDETIGTFGTTVLPLYWSDKARQEWSVRYKHENWNYNLQIH